MTMHLHILKGCSPAPLANYLKALGILRLVGEQADEQVRGWWDGENFCLLTKLSKEELEDFFLEQYEPTPLLSPWNKGCGFFNSDDPGLDPIERSTARRFDRFRRGIKDARLLSDAISKADAVIRAIKARTKTNRSFQSSEQRELLSGSETFRICLQSYQLQLANPGMMSQKQAQLEHEIATVQSIVSEAENPPSKTEATILKSSAGYKRLLARLPTASFATGPRDSRHARITPAAIRTQREQPLPASFHTSLAGIDIHPLHYLSAKHLDKLSDGPWCDPPLRASL